MLAAAVLYVRQFYRRRLYRYSACRRHHDVMPLPELHCEAKWLLGHATRPLPFMLIMPRCYALFYELLERAACDIRFSDEQRRQAIRVAIDAKDEMLRRCPKKFMPDIEELIAKHCAKVRRMRRFPKASDLIRDPTREFRGSFSTARRVLIHPGSNRLQ